MPLQQVLRAGRRQGRRQGRRRPRLQLAQANKARNAKLVHEAVSTYRNGVEAWMRERAPLLGYGIGLSLNELDLYNKVATRTEKGEEGLRERRRCQAYRSMWWDGPVVREQWEKIWGNTPGYARHSSTNGLSFISFDDLLDLDDEEACEYAKIRLAAHWLAVKEVLAGAPLRVGRRVATGQGTPALCVQASC